MTSDVHTLTHQTSDVKPPQKVTASRGHAGVMDMKLELIMLPVSDVDRTRDFYAERVASLSITIRWSAEMIHHMSEVWLLQDLYLQTRPATTGASQ